MAYLGKKSCCGMSGLGMFTCPAGSMELGTPAFQPAPGWVFLGYTDHATACWMSPPPPPTPAAAPAHVTVSPNIVTTVNPQVSPVFQQTQGSSGAQSAGTTQGPVVTPPIVAAPPGVVSLTAPPTATTTPDWASAIAKAASAPQQAPQTLITSTSGGGGSPVAAGSLPEPVTTPAIIGAAQTSNAPASLLPAGASSNMVMWAALAGIGALILVARQSKGHAS